MGEESVERRDAEELAEALERIRDRLRSSGELFPDVADNALARFRSKYPKEDES